VAVRLAVLFGNAWDHVIGEHGYTLYFARLSSFIGNKIHHPLPNKTISLRKRKASSQGTACYLQFFRFQVKESRGSRALQPQPAGSRIHTQHIGKP